MIAFRKLWLLLFLSFAISCAYSQDISWMMGKWKGENNSKKVMFTRMLDITSVSSASFSGTRTIEANDRNNTKIVTEISGHINKDTFYIKDGAIIFKKDPPHTTWLSCADCTPFNKVYINGDSILLTTEISNCQPYCNGVFSYYKMIPDFDTATQRVVITMFGTPEQIEAFNRKQIVPPVVASADPDAVKQRQQKIDDSLKYAANIQKAKRQQEITDSLKNAAAIAKQKQQQYDDSVKLVKQRQQQIEDSLQNVAKLEKARREKEIADSIAIAKQKQQQYDDSVRIAKQRQQQIEDSLQNVAKLEKARREKEIADSVKNAAAIAKQKQQQYDDSVRIAKQRQQQIEDSLQTVAKLKKARREKETADSIKNAEAIAKQKQQQYDDSVRIAKQRQQQIEDSLQNVAKLEKAKREKEIADSIKNAQAIAKQKQQQYDDSVRIAKLSQQHIQDSLQNVAAIAKKRQQQIADSLKTVAAIAKQKRQQQIADSIKIAEAIAKQKQQRYDDSLKLAQQRQKQIQDSLQNIANITKIRQQEIQDSIKIAAGKKQLTPDTAKTAVAKAQVDKGKALTQRDNVLLETYHIKSPDILIELFDNAEIDGDRVSVFHNNQVIVNNQMLTHDPIIYKIHADSTNRTHEFILVAENLGTIPPNTALMRVTADKQVYKLSVKTDLKTNAKIVFYYDGN